MSVFSFIYDKDVEFDHPNTVAEFYSAAHKYICKDALIFAKDYMTKELNPQSAIIFYETAVFYDIPDLKEACLKVCLLLYFTNLSETST